MPTSARTLPRVHVVLATYCPNERFLREQVGSVLRQEDVELTLAIVDDGTPSAQLESLRSIVGSDARVTVSSGPRVGAFYNFERGLAQAPREVDAVLLADQDDVWHERRAITAVMALRDSGAVLSHSDARVVDDTGAVLAESMFAREKRNLTALDLDHLIAKNVVTGCTLALRPALLDVALPFPRADVPPGYHHDLWLALCAAATGGITTIQERLVDYRQHSSNVLGLQPWRSPWLRPRAALVEWRVRQEVAHAGTAAIAAGQLQPDAARAFRRWSRRTAPLHAVWLACSWALRRDRSASFALYLGLAGLLAPVRRAARGAGSRRVGKRARGAGWMVVTAARLTFRLASQPEARRKALERLRQDSVPHIDGDPFPHVVRPFPVELRPDGARTIHVLVPKLPRAGVFGGVATALRLAVELAGRGEAVQVVETDETDELLRDEALDVVSRSLGVDRGWADRLTFFDLVNPAATLPVGRHDIFVATAWWTALRAHRTRPALGPSAARIAYLVQDFEPSFYAASDAQVLSGHTYELECWPVINAAPLAAHLERETPLAVDPDLILAPQVDVAALARLPRKAADTGPLRVLLYGRPWVPRNLFETALRGLGVWLRQRDPARAVEVISVGQRHDPVPLGEGVTVESRGQLAWSDYEAELQRAHIGLSLMFSPHPSYPPLEMAAAGLVVVTNTAFGKDLASLSPRFVTCAPLPTEIAMALTEAEQRQASLGEVGRDFRLDPLGRAMSDVVSSLRERFPTL